MPVAHEHRRHIDPRVVLPCDPAGTVGLHRRDIVARIPTAHEHAPSIGHRGGDALLRRALDLPQLAPRLRIKRGDEVATAKDHLRLSRSLDHRRARVIGDLGPVLRPHRPARDPIKGDDFSPAAVIRADQHHRTVNDRGGSKSLMHHKIGDARLPEELALWRQG